jgi:hypothetical protein
MAGQQIPTEQRPPSPQAPPSRFRQVNIGPAHSRHAPAQALAQHRPATQLEDLQSPLATQASPGFFFSGSAQRPSTQTSPIAQPTFLVSQTPAALQVRVTTVLLA